MAQTGHGATSAVWKKLSCGAADDLHYSHSDPSGKGDYV